MVPYIYMHLHTITISNIHLICNTHHINIPSSFRNLRKGCDYVDISLVDGWTLPVKLDIQGDCHWDILGLRDWSGGCHG